MLTSLIPRKLQFTLLFIVGAFVAFGGLFIQSAFAQEAGVSISPARIDEMLEPGIIKEYSFTVRNLNNTEQTYFLSKRNISGVRDGGVPIFDDVNAERSRYNLVEWLSVSTDTLTVPGGATAEVTLTLSVPSDATPGSHFGGIFVSVDAPEIEQSGAAVGYQVANIISIRVAGEANENASIRQFSTDQYFHGSKNVDFSVRIENTGNVLVRPVGPLEIFNMLGQKVDTITFNESQGDVFPESIREFNFNWTAEGTGFGRYEAILSPAYGDVGARRTMSSTASFWVLPMNIILPALGALVTILLITFFFVRMYIRRTLAHMTGGTRLVRRRKQKGSSATLLIIIVLLVVTALFLLVLLAVFA
jgi:hypothetical protein